MAAVRDSAAAAVDERNPWLGLASFTEETRAYFFGRDAEIAELKSVLKSRLGKEPRLHSKVDPTLLGGLVVKVGSRMIDSSLRTKLDGLRSAMKG